jgi:hypothetical protein
MATIPEGYRIETVYGRLSEALAAEIVNFWQQQRVLPSRDEARRRVVQVVDVIRNAAGEIVGLNSVYPGAYRSPQDNYYFYRLFIRQQDRKPGLGRAATRHAVEFLQTRPNPKMNIKGVIAVTENPKLTREGGRRLLQRLGFAYDGRGPKGFDIWKIEFPPQQPAPPT